MRVAVLTTETAHHAFFVKQLACATRLEQVILERRVPQPGFETHHPFEDVRDDHERRVLLESQPVDVRHLAATLELDSVNDPPSLARLRQLQPDAIVVFGTGPISPEVIDTCPRGMVNLHGGDPEEYRGLDTHLWALYHRDFDGLVTTLHRVNPRLDDGDIVLQAGIPLRRGMGLHELRGCTARVCVRLTLAALDMYARNGDFLSRPQRRRGRYYSFMPAPLKDVCRARFESYTSELP